MDLIDPGEVIRRIRLYFDGGMVKYLRPRQRQAAERGVGATARNAYDRRPLNLHNAGLACERFLGKIPALPRTCAGRGVIICAGGLSDLSRVKLCITTLRRRNCQLPIQVWHLGRREMHHRLTRLLAPAGVETVDAFQVRRTFPARLLHRPELKAYALVRSRFLEILALDADAVPPANPDVLFATPQFRATGAIFSPSCKGSRNRQAAAVWRSCGLRWPREPGFGAGQMVLDKRRCWPALCLAWWFNENSDFYYQHLRGEAEAFQLAFRKLTQPYAVLPCLPAA